MGLNLTVYVGPYIVAPKGFDWMPYEHIVCDRRYETDRTDEELYLIPNCPLPFSRQTTIDKHGFLGVLRINGSHLGEEMMAFHEMTQQLRDDHPEARLTIRWGVVPCYS
jgi:hypothetical protein